MARGWECAAVALLLVGVAPVHASVCSDHLDGPTCDGQSDGGCLCVWDGSKCEKGKECGGIGMTALGCMLDNGSMIEDGASVPGEGDNWCNECVCMDGSLACSVGEGCGSPTPMTCGEVKQAYKDNGCCGYPEKPMHMHGRRLSAAASGGDIVAQIGAALREAEAKGGRAQARQLAELVNKLLTPHVGA